MHNRAESHLRKSHIQHAGSLFEWIYFKGKVLGVLASVTGDSRQIPFLSDHEVDGEQVTFEKIGLQPVRVQQIIGTIGRRNYDKDFYPLQRRDKPRWISVAIAMMSDVTSLAPITVIQVNDQYYTSDGNHRVSVARTLNKLFIDANVTRWIFPQD